MATPINGKLGAVACVANATNIIYTVPSGVTSTCLTLNVVNTGTSSVKVKVAITTATTPTAADWIEYDTVIQTGGALERTGIVLSTGEKLVVTTPDATVVARAHGYEDV